MKQDRGTGAAVASGTERDAADASGGNFRADRVRLVAGVSAVALAAALLTGAALADGGSGGGTGGGAGGTLENPQGGDAAPGSNGGGGGGPGGGLGGAADGTGGAGGTGGAHGFQGAALPGGSVTGGDGTWGTGASASNGGGGGGGAGGYGAVVTGAGNSAVAAGQVFQGGHGWHGAGWGGSGGDGGFGLLFTGGTLSNAGALRGGNGGNGQGGTDPAGSGGAGGGGLVYTGTVFTNASEISGGRGGTGGTSLGQGGNGGAGGIAVIFSGQQLINSGAITGGLGEQGAAATTAGRGGDGGHGVLLLSGGTLENLVGGTITGGNAGQGGAGTAINGGFGGDGGDGVRGDNATIINRGIIRGGRYGNDGAGGGDNWGANGYAIRGANLAVLNSGVLQAGGPNGVNAVHFTGGTNTLTLEAGSSITGQVVADGTNDALILGGDGPGIGQFNMGGIYLGFEVFEKRGAGTWRTTGTGSGTLTSIDVLEGELQSGSHSALNVNVAAGASLTGGGTVGDVFIADQGIIAPSVPNQPNTVDTLTMSSLTLSNGSLVNFDLGWPWPGASEKIVVTGGLTLNGTLNVAERPGFGSVANNGVYTLIEYGSLVADNGLLLGTLPAGYSYEIGVGTVVANAVTLTVATVTGNQFWDGASQTSGTIEGGSGVWNASNTNWTNAAGSSNAAWQGEFAIFGGAAGTVTVEGTQAFTGMQFLTNGYTLAAGTGGLLDADAAGVAINVGSGITATLGVQVTGGPVTKVQGGRLVLTAAEIVDPSAAAETWIVEGGELVIDGSFVADEWDNDTAVILRNGATLTVTEFGSIGAQTALDTFISIEGQGHVSIEEGGLATAYISGTASDSTVTIAGTLGSVTRGGVVDLTGARNFVEVTETGEINTPQGTTIGIGVTGDDNSIVMNGEIRGRTPRAIRIVGNTNTVSVGGTIETTGFAAGSAVPVGISVSGDDNAITIENGGTVRTLGEGSPAIATTGTHNQVTVSGVVTTEGGVEEFFGYGGSTAISMHGSNNVLEITSTGNVFVTHADVDAITFLGDNSTVTLSGTVAAASAGETAILFDGGGISSTNILELQPGYSITGLVVGDAAAFQNHLILGGSGSATFDVSDIGGTEQFRNFDRFYKDGDSVWTLEGTNDDLTPGLPSLWIYRGGTLLVNGSMAGTGFSNYGNTATLGGTGTVGYLEALSGATIAPGGVAAGSRIGTLNVVGNVSFNPGSTFAVDIAGNGQGDRVAAGGVATLNGGTVSVTALDPQTSYQNGQTYTILTAAGGVNGTFDGAVSQSIFVTPTLDYSDPGTVVLGISLRDDTGPQPGRFAGVARTFNQIQAATALDGLDQTAGSDANAVYVAILNASTSEDAARAIFDSVSGEIHASGQHVIDQTFALFNRTLRHQGVAGIGSGNVGADVFTSPLGYGPVTRNAAVDAVENVADYADARVRGAWAAPLGGVGRIDGDGNAARLDWWNAGLAAGYEGALDAGAGKAMGGVGFGYIRSHGRVADRQSAFDSDGFHLGAYGAWTRGPWALAGSLSYGAALVSTGRDIAFMGRTATAAYWAHSIGLSGEASYGFDLAAATRVAPLLTLDTGWSGHGGFAETGAGALNLSSGPESWMRLDAGIGLALTHAIATGSGRVTLEGRAAWEHAFADAVPSQALGLEGSPAGFTVHGPAAGRDRLRIGAGVSWDVSDKTAVRVRYDGLFSAGQASHTASLGLKVRF